MDYSEATTSKRKLDDDDAGSDSDGRKNKRPMFEFHSAAPIPDNVDPALVLRQLEHARACRDMRTGQIRETEARLQQAKAELSMILDELSESREKRTEIDFFIGRLKNYMYAHNIPEKPCIPRVDIKSYDSDIDDVGDSYSDGYDDDDDDDGDNDNDNDAGGGDDAALRAREFDQAEGPS